MNNWCTIQDASAWIIGCTLSSDANSKWKLCKYTKKNLYISCGQRGGGLRNWILPMNMCWPGLSVKQQLLLIYLTWRSKYSPLALPLAWSAIQPCPWDSSESASFVCLVFVINIHSPFHLYAICLQNLTSWPS